MNDLKCAFERRVFRRAVFVAIIVGILLNMINQGSKIVDLEFGQINYLKLCLTFMVPYLVSTYSSVLAKRNFIPGEISNLDIHLECHTCKDTDINLKKSEIIPECNTCRSATDWRISRKSSTELKRMEEELKSRALFMEFNPAPVMRIDPEGNIIESNIAANSIFKSNALINQQVAGIMPGIKEINIAKVIENEEILDFVEKLDHKLIRIEVRGIKELNVCQLYGADISEILKTQKDNAKYITAIEQSYNSIMITDIRGNIEFVNQAFEEQTGYKISDVIGKNPKFLKSGKTTQEEYKEMWETITSGKVWKGEFHNRKKDGSFYWELATISPVLNNEQEIISYLAVKEDVTEQKAMQEKMKSMAMFARLNPEPVFRFNGQGTILQSNPAANEAFHLENLEGKNITEILYEIRQINIVEFIGHSKITTITETIEDKIFRFILRGLSDLGICQIYGSDITERVKQQEKILEQKRNITKSIEYASRIQNAVLPPVNLINRVLPENFIIFKPRDIVSGDFYWMSQKDKKVILVAADCTGHGVPGAFMSMLGISFLNEIVSRQDVLHANEILNQLRTSVKNTLMQTGKDGEAKDGMDIALCILDFENYTIQYAGAYNPLYLYRNNELIETKADKMPIGIYVREKESFTNHEFKMEIGETYYIFSDGFVDQFGGEKEQKYKSVNFKQLLQKIHQKPLIKQKEILEKEFIDWKRELEQIDDILVIGFRIT